MKVGVERIQRQLPHRLHHKITRPEYSAPQEIYKNLTNPSWISAILPFSITNIIILKFQRHLHSRYYHSWLQPTILPFSITHNIIILEYQRHSHSQQQPTLLFSTTPILPFSTPITCHIAISIHKPTLPFLTITNITISDHTHIILINHISPSTLLSPFTPHIIPNHSTLGTSLINP